MIVVVELSFLHACLEMKYPLLLHLIVPPNPFHYFAHPIIHSIHPNQMQAYRLPQVTSLNSSITHTARRGHKRLFVKLLAAVQIAFLWPAL